MSTPVREATLRCFEPRQAPKRRLICLPYAGGGPATYRPWSQHLPDDVEVVAVQFPGREPPYREPPLDSIADLVASLLPPLAERADLPFALFGHSMGALVAFEATLAMERDGGPSPSLLFVSSRRPPDEPADHAPVHDLPDDAFVDAMVHRYNAVPEIVRREPDLMALLLPVLRADIRAFETLRAAQRAQGAVPGPRVRRHRRPPPAAGAAPAVAAGRRARRERACVRGRPLLPRRARRGRRRRHRRHLGRRRRSRRSISERSDRHRRDGVPVPRRRRPIPTSFWQLLADGRRRDPRDRPRRPRPRPLLRPGRRGRRAG